MATEKDIPERERWLYENPRSLASVLRGLAQAKAMWIKKQRAKGIVIGD